MGFLDWKRRSKNFTALYGRFGAPHLSAIEAACKAAFMAGYRDGKKDSKSAAMNGVALAVLLERQACADAAEESASDASKYEIADSIRMRSGAEGACMARPAEIDT